MPNIEIHGVADAEQSKELRKHVFGAFQQKSFAKDLVVTVCHDTCLGPNGQDSKEESFSLPGYGRLDPMPFFRVVSTPQAYLDEIVKELISSFGLDVELMLLSKFFPAVLE